MAELDGKIGLLLAFVTGVVVTKNWTRIRDYTADICHKTLSFAGFGKTGKAAD